MTFAQTDDTCGYYPGTSALAALAQGVIYEQRPHDRWRARTLEPVKAVGGHWTGIALGIGRTPERAMADLWGAIARAAWVEVYPAARVRWDTPTGQWRDVTPTPDRGDTA